MRTIVDNCAAGLTLFPSAKGKQMPRINVLLSEEENVRFSAYCTEKGHKKSTLVARLIRELLDREGFVVQASLPFGEDGRMGSRKQKSKRSRVTNEK